jgi:hypothetical protein
LLVAAREGVIVSVAVGRGFHRLCVVQTAVVHIQATLAQLGIDFDEAFAEAYVAPCVVLLCCTAAGITVSTPTTEATNVAFYASSDSAVAP